MTLAICPICHLQGLPCFLGQHLLDDHPDAPETQRLRAFVDMLWAQPEEERGDV